MKWINAILAFVFGTLLSTHSTVLTNMDFKDKIGSLQAKTLLLQMDVDRLQGLNREIRMLCESEPKHL